MISKELIDRINFLARKQRDGGLTPEEKAEQKKLRELYLENIRSQVIEALESAGFTRKNNHPATCGCSGCNGEEHRKPRGGDDGDPCGCGGNREKPGRIFH
ncbi:MAG: DUF896 domain-containing protein [Firmicutes bacterium]|nr:DUF896 domain-containing protein [Bacillota bacterium]